MVVAQTLRILVVIRERSDQGGDKRVRLAFLISHYAGTQPFDGYGDKHVGRTESGRPNTQYCFHKIFSTLTAEMLIIGEPL